MVLLQVLQSMAHWCIFKFATNRISDDCLRIRHFVFCLMSWFVPHSMDIFFNAFVWRDGMECWSGGKLEGKLFWTKENRKKDLNEKKLDGKLERKNSNVKIRTKKFERKNLNEKNYEKDERMEKEFGGKGRKLEERE